MKILGIESSCDDSGASVVENGVKVLSNVVSSQIDIHNKTGGVVPEVAAREHLLNILPVIDSALKKANTDLNEIDAIAVTKGPGLISSLIIGTQTANVLSIVKNKVLIPVHHIVGHIYSNWLDIEDEIVFPVIVLTVSGGHNEIILMRDHLDFQVLGESRDDACGEAFDKVARILNMGYPGGPEIYKASLKGNENAFKLPKAMLEKGSLDFSFSGLKTAVLNEYLRYIQMNNIKEEKDLSEKFKCDISASFQKACNEVLSDKVIMALNQYPEAKEIHLAGGVSANLNLREMIKSKIPNSLKFRFPKSLKYCTDNASMIASAGYFIYNSRKESCHSSSNIIPSTDFSM